MLDATWWILMVLIKTGMCWGFGSSDCCRNYAQSASIFERLDFFGLAKCANTGVVHTILVQKNGWATCHTVFYMVLKGRPNLDPHLDAKKKARAGCSWSCHRWLLSLKKTVLRGLWWNISGWKKNRGNWWILRDTVHPMLNRSIRIYHLRDWKFNQQSQ